MPDRIPPGKIRFHTACSKMPRLGAAVFLQIYPVNPCTRKDKHFASNAGKLLLVLIVALGVNKLFIPISMQIMNQSVEGSVEKFQRIQKSNLANINGNKCLRIGRNDLDLAFQKFHLHVLQN